MSTDAYQPTAEIANSALMALEGVSHVYRDRDGELTALDKISFQVRQREFLCLVGPSGSGKTTLLRLMAGLVQPTAGEVLLAGRPLDGPRRQVGIVFQKPNLMPWRTVSENVALPLELAGMARGKAARRAAEMIALVGLSDYAALRPRSLSGGMAQRVAIARALAHEPEILLLDEPFGALDALTRERMGLELLRIWRASQKTVVMVTHNIQEAVLLADRVLVLSSRPGRVRTAYDVPLPRPRDPALQYQPEFGALALQIRAAIR